MMMDDAVNVFDETLSTCSEEPMTGFFRDGSCNTCKEDVGLHTVCVRVSNEFLEYSLSVGNDLSTPMPEYGFEGLKDGDAWCLCAARWLQAEKENKAPRVYLRRTHKRALEIVSIEILKKYAADLS